MNVGANRRNPNCTSTAGVYACVQIDLVSDIRKPFCSLTVVLRFAASWWWSVILWEELNLHLDCVQRTAHNADLNNSFGIKLLKNAIYDAFMCELGYTILHNNNYFNRQF